MVGIILVSAAIAALASAGTCMIVFGLTGAIAQPRPRRPRYRRRKS